MACSYCVPEKYSTAKNIPDLINLGNSSLGASGKRLSNSELFQVVSVLHKELDLKETRLTGGEPLLRPELPELIKGIKSIGINKIGLTTNGFLLPLHAKRLKAVGLQSVNVSLDAADPAIFKQITGKNYLNKVLEGIDSAKRAGLVVKINSVILRNINTNQIIPLLDFAFSKDITIRFIELMKMGHLYKSNTNLFYPAIEILDQIKSKYSITELLRTASSTAHYWNASAGKKFGIIANEGLPFCSDCDRLRLDEYGRVFGCISSNKGFSLKEYTKSPKELRSILNEALSTKRNHFTGSLRSMINLGG